MKLDMPKNNKGFSLIELMVVVAIIGILATIAVPQVSKFISKSKQSEAKGNLAALYSAEKAFFAEYNGYSTTITTVGYAPEGGLRYNTGFSAAVAIATSAPNYNGPAPSADISTNLYCGTKAVPGASQGKCFSLEEATGQAIPGTTLSNAAFVARSVALLLGTKQDEWSINQNKELQWVNSGID